MFEGFLDFALSYFDSSVFFHLVQGVQCLKIKNSESKILAQLSTRLSPRASAKHIHSLPSF